MTQRKQGLGKLSVLENLEVIREEFQDKAFDQNSNEK